MWSRNERKGIVFLLLIALIVAFAVIIVIQTSKVDVVSNILNENQVVRVLYVIEDESPEQEKDILLTELIVYYPVSNRVIILNVPRNTGAIYESLNRTDAIASVYREHGIGKYVTEIEKILGVSIPFYVCFTKEQFLRSVDMIGGLRIFIPKPIDSMGEQGTRFLLPQGSVLLDGEKAIAYLTYKDSQSSAKKENERYQDVILSYFDGLSRNSSRILHKNGFDVFSKEQTTNLELVDFYTLIAQLSKIQTSYCIRQNITGQTYVIEEKELLFPSSGGTAIRQALNQATNMLLSTGDASSSRTYVIEVQNGTTRQGLARNTGILLENAGYEIFRATNADKNDYEKTVIIDNIGNSDVAKILADFIKCKNIVTSTIGDENQQNVNSDFTIILGKDFDGRYVQ